MRRNKQRYDSLATTQRRYEGDAAPETSISDNRPNKRLRGATVHHTFLKRRGLN